MHLSFNHSDTFQFIREQLKYMARTSGICNPTLLEKRHFTLTEFQFCNRETSHESFTGEQEHLTNSACPFLMEGAHVLLRPNKADLDVSSWTQEWAKLFGTGRQIPEPIGPFLTTALLSRRLLKEVLAPLPDLRVHVRCSGNAQHFGVILPNPLASLSGSRLLTENRLQPVKGTRREHAELFFPPLT